MLWRMIHGWLLAACLLQAAPAWAVKKKPKADARASSRWPMALSVTPRLGLSDVADVPVGAGVAAQFVVSPLPRFGVGLETSWSRHGAMDFLRAALLLQILIDDLAIHPFLQTGVGLQMRLQPDGVAFTPDIHLGLGFDVPILSWFGAGASFQIHFPIDPQGFPITKTLHLRLRLVF